MEFGWKLRAVSMLVILGEGTRAKTLVFYSLELGYGVGRPVTWLVCMAWERGRDEEDEVSGQHTRCAIRERSRPSSSQEWKLLEAFEHTVT